MSDEILDGTARVLEDLARGRPRPVGMVAIGSRRRATLVGSLAERLTAASKLPLLGILPAVPSSPGAKRANSARRVAARHEAFRVPAAVGAACNEIAGSVLLVDDLVNSGWWTMTLTAQALRRAGAESVLPFALAIMGRRE